jgi:hypothetical protein
VDNPNSPRSGSGQVTTSRALCVLTLVTAARPGPESRIDDCAALAGGSFEEFYEAQYAAVVRLAAALVGRWDVSEELVQDAVIALYPRLDRV